MEASMPVHLSRIVTTGTENRTFLGRGLLAIPVFNNGPESS
jgi:hypothetical protein